MTTGGGDKNNNMNVVKSLSIYLIQMQASWKLEMYKKLKEYMLKKRLTPEEFITYCNQEIKHISTKSRLQIKRIQQK